MSTKQFCFMQNYLKTSSFLIIYFSFLVVGWIDLAAPPVIFPYLEKDHQIDVSPLADVGGGAGGLWGGGLGVGHQGVGARPVEGGLGVEVLGGRRRRGQRRRLGHLHGADHGGGGGVVGGSSASRC